MDLLVIHFNSLTFLFAGALCIILGVYAFVKQEFLLGWVLCILGASFTAQGFLDLTKLTVPGWVSPSIDAVCGIVVIWLTISGGYTAPSWSSRRRTYWWLLAFGMGAILLAIFEARQYYWA
jgi:hypothetical protein